MQRGLLRWILSLHIPTYNITLSPKKLPQVPEGDAPQRADENQEVSWDADQEDDPDEEIRSYYAQSILSAEPAHRSPSSEGDIHPAFQNSAISSSYNNESGFSATRSPRPGQPSTSV